MSHEAYKKAAQTLSGARDAEYRAFSESTRRLLAAAQTKRNDLKALIEAVHKNRELWGALAADCADDGNALPRATRAQIISLSRFVAEYSKSVMQKDESLDPLIDLNRIIMDGLARRSAA
jgi:flagellar protein FlaF